MKLVQIVITRKDAKTFRATTFDKKECRGSRLLSEGETLKLVGKTMKKLRRQPGLDSE